MAIYCIDDGGDGSQTNTTHSASTLDWSKADTSVDNLISYDAAAFTTGGNVIYFGDDHSDPNKAAHWTLTGPTSGLPVVLISADRTQSTPTYKVGTGNQLSSLGGAYDITLDGSFALYGILSNAGRDIVWKADSDEYCLARNVKVIVAATRSFIPCGDSNGTVDIDGLIVDVSNDANASSTVPIKLDAIGEFRISNVTFVIGGTPYRTGSIFSVLGGACISGVDFSGHTNATLCELIGSYLHKGVAYVTNCISQATWAPFNTTRPTASGSVMVTNTGPADAPTYLASRSYKGDVLSTTAIYRTGGATVEGDACSWLITTTANCDETVPHYTPWIYGTVASTGSKTFDLYITHDADTTFAADFTDAQVWLEVESLSTADEAISAFVTDQRSTITATAAAQTGDTTSTWNGTGPSFTYKQKLSVTATVNETGQYRARVAVGAASIGSAHYFYVDPKVTVS